MKISLTFVFLILLPAVSQGQSLADIARQERARKKNVESRVYTNADLTGDAAVAAAESTPGVAAAPSPNELQSSQPSQTPASSPQVQRTDRQGRSEDYWRTAFQTARDEVRRAEDNVRVAELRVNELNRRLLLESSTYNREYRLAGEIADARAALDQARTDLQQSRQRIVDLEDELRRSGGLPGWAR